MGSGTRPAWPHAYFLDDRTDRAAYSDAFFRNLGWHVVDGRVKAYGIPVG